LAPGGGRGCPVQIFPLNTISSASAIASSPMLSSHAAVHASLLAAQSPHPSLPQRLNSILRQKREFPRTADHRSNSSIAQRPKRIPTSDRAATVAGEELRVERCTLLWWRSELVRRGQRTRGTCSE
jgi:hypothetical protein